MNPDIFRPLKTQISYSYTMYIACENIDYYYYKYEYPD